MVKIKNLTEIYKVKNCLLKISFSCWSHSLVDGFCDTRNYLVPGPYQKGNTWMNESCHDRLVCHARGSQGGLWFGGHKTSNLQDLSVNVIEGH